MKASIQLPSSDRRARFVGVVFDFYDATGVSTPLLVFEWVDVSVLLYACVTFRLRETRCGSTFVSAARVAAALSSLARS